MPHHHCCEPAPCHHGHGGAGHDPGYGSGMPVPYWYYYVPYCSSCGQPLWCCGCGQSGAMDVPQELAVDPTTTTKELVVGGASDVHLILEYLRVEGAPAPKVTLASAGPSGTSSFEDAAITAGFHVKDDFAATPPGTKLKLTVTDGFARLRWCERVEY